MNDNKNVPKKKKRKLKVGYLLSCILILVVIVLGIKMILPGNSSKYGDRLEGIKKIKFDKKDQEKIVNKIKNNEKVTECKINVQGRIINLIFNVKNFTSADEAKAIANDSLPELSDEVKGYYDVQFMITQVDEEGRKVEGSEEVLKTYPIIGYRNGVKNHPIVWSNIR